MSEREWLHLTFNLTLTPLAPAMNSDPIKSELESLVHISLIDAPIQADKSDCKSEETLVQISLNGSHPKAETSDCKSEEPLVHIVNDSLSQADKTDKAILTSTKDKQDPPILPLYKTKECTDKPKISITTIILDTVILFLSILILSIILFPENVPFRSSNDASLDVVSPFANGHDDTTFNYQSSDSLEVSPDNVIAHLKNLKIIANQYHDSSYSHDDPVHSMVPENPSFNSQSSDPNLVVSSDNVIAHLKNLELIAAQHNGSRSVTNGHDASVDYVVSQLDLMADSFTYWTQDVPVLVQVNVEEPSLTIITSTATVELEPRIQVAIVQGSGSVKVINANAVLYTECDAEHTEFDNDYSEMKLKKDSRLKIKKADKISNLKPKKDNRLNIKTKENRKKNWVAVIGTQRSSKCSPCDKLVAAYAAGASAIVFYGTPGNQNGYPHPLPPSPGYCARKVQYRDIMSKMGVVSVSETVAFDMIQLLAAQDLKMSMNIKSSYQVVISRNIIAESISGSNESIVIFGSHLDSVPAGPGINDDGSGAMATLELANAFHSSLISQSSVQKIRYTYHDSRFAWWTAEEIGLHGSTYYVKTLIEGNPQELLAHKLNIDTDMIASSNYVRGIWSGAHNPNPKVAAQCEILTKVFSDWFEDQGLETTPFEFNGRSDFAPFLDAGIPAGGVITGEDEIKTADGAARFGGISGMVLDPCYHQDCDRAANLVGPAKEVMTQNLNALVYALEFFAMNEDLDGFLNTGNYY